jgi:hypothetical protein
MGKQARKPTQLQDSPQIPPLIQGRDKMYCAEMCGVNWVGRGRKRARKIKPRYRVHYMRKHFEVDET